MTQNKLTIILWTFNSCVFVLATGLFGLLFTLAAIAIISIKEGVL